MKIFLLGVFKPGSASYGHANGFEELGHTVFRYNFRAELASHGTVALRDDHLKAAIRKWEPDLTVFPKCNNMGVSCVAEANQVGSSCLWYMDPQNGNFNDELHEKIRAATFSAFGLQQPCESARRNVPRATIHLIPEGHDRALDGPADCEKVYDVSFIGSPRGERGPLCEAVEAHVIQGVYDQAHARAVAKSCINLNFTEGGTSDRTYKVLGAKGFLLTQPWPDIELMFDVGNDLVTFEGVADLKDKIRYYLENKGERNRIAAHGHETAIRDYTWASWAMNIIEATQRSKQGERDG